MIRITEKWLDKWEACLDGKDWIKKHKNKNMMELLKQAEKDNHLDWYNWGIVRKMNHKQQIQFAIYAAEQVRNIYEKKFPNDDRPRKAISVAKVYLKKPNEDNKKNASASANASADAAAASAADAAADASASASAYAAYAAAADDASAAAAYAASAAAYAAAASAYAAAASAYASAYANDAAYAADAANDAMKIKIIKYGLKLLKAR